MGVGGQRHAPAGLPSGKTRYPLYRRQGGPQGRSGRVRKISPLTGIYSSDRPARSESLYLLRYPGPYVKFPVCYGTRRFITVFASARHLSPSWAILVQSMLQPPPLPTKPDTLRDISKHADLW